MGTVSPWRLGGRGHGVGVRPGQGRIQHGILGFFGCRQSEVDGVDGVALGPVGVALGAREVVLRLLHFDALPDVLDMVIPAALQLVSVRFSLLGRLLGHCGELGSVLVGGLACLVGLGLELGAVPRSRRPDVALALLDSLPELPEAV